MVDILRRGRSDYRLAQFLEAARYAIQQAANIPRFHKRGPFEVIGITRRSHRSELVEGEKFRTIVGRDVGFGIFPAKAWLGWVKSQVVTSGRGALMYAAIATTRRGTRTNIEVPQRWLSAPFSKLLADTPVTAAELDAELDTPAARRVAVTLRPPHPLIGSIQKATGLNVVEIGRRHRRLIVAVEEFDRHERSWFYREITRHTCLFGCPGIVPEQKKSALIGGPLALLADPHPALNAARILQIDDASDGWSEVRLDPGWVKF